MRIFLNIATVLDDFARSERRTEPCRITAWRSDPKYQHFVCPCEGCGKGEVCGTGLCPTCLELAAGACRIRAKGIK